MRRYERLRRVEADLSSSFFWKPCRPELPASLPPVSASLSRSAGQSEASPEKRASLTHRTSVEIDTCDAFPSWG